MIDELIRKADVIDLLSSLDLNLIDYDLYSQLFDMVDNIQPVNAVELPCKVGDTVYEVWCKQILKHVVTGFVIKEQVEIIRCQTSNFCAKEINRNFFLSREEAEKALEDLKNG